MKKLKALLSILLCIAMLSLVACRKREVPAEAVPTAAPAPAAPAATAAPEPAAEPEPTPSISETLEQYQEAAEGYVNSLSQPITYGAEFLSAYTGMLEQFLSPGYTLEEEPEQMLEPGEVSPEMTVNGPDFRLAMRIANPGTEAIPLLKGVIASIRLTDPAFQFANVLRCGEATFEQVRGLLGLPYFESPEELIYRIGFTDGDAWAAIKAAFPKAAELEDFGRNLRFLFEDGVLNAIVLEASAYLYGGMQDNVEPALLPELTEEELAEAAEIRDSISERLVKAFEEAGIEAIIHPVSGEVSLPDAVLFGNDRYDLSEEGKTYLDNVCAAYASVVLDGDFEGDIAKILFEGHASPLGTFDYNEELSLKRAETVLNHCLTSEGNGLDDAARARLTALSETVGRSYTDPVFNAEGEVDMDASRRVAIKFFVQVG